MSLIKLDRLPDRNPVKITITIPPTLNRSLVEYAKAYEAEYGEAEPLVELIPAMLSAFIEADRAFARRRRKVAD